MNSLTNNRIDWIKADKTFKYIILGLIGFLICSMLTGCTDVMGGTDPKTDHVGAATPEMMKVAAVCLIVGIGNMLFEGFATVTIICFAIVVLIA